VRFRFTPVYPSDIVLGPLQHEDVGSVTDRSAYAAARGFLTSLLGGELPADWLVADIGWGARSILDALLEQSQQFHDVRIGELVALTEIDVSMRFRLVGDEKEAEGELILTSEGGKWYISDVQTAFLDRPADRSFEPAATNPLP
jgi:hypothetical protein